jgi:hypothetical protein
MTHKYTSSTFPRLYDKADEHRNLFDCGRFWAFLYRLFSQAIIQRLSFHGY